MFGLLIKSVLILVAAVVAHKLWEMWFAYLDYHYYKKQGVVFTSSRYGFFPDLIKIFEANNKYPNTFSWRYLMRDALKTDRLPQITGVVFGGTTQLIVTSADLLQDLYVKQNSKFTKNHVSRWQFWKLMGTSIVF